MARYQSNTRDVHLARKWKTSNGESSKQNHEISQGDEPEGVELPGHGQTAGAAWRGFRRVPPEKRATAGQARRDQRLPAAARVAVNC